MDSSEIQPETVTIYTRALSTSILFATPDIAVILTISIRAGNWMPMHTTRLEHSSNVSGFGVLLQGGFLFLSR
jgi:hypothetical protein